MGNGLIINNKNCPKCSNQSNKNIQIQTIYVTAPMLLQNNQKHTEVIRRLSQILLDDLENGKPQILSIQDREIIARCWRRHIAGKRTDIFHKTMLKCIESSPKLNEIIACGRYCYRDLRKWPKLNKICQSQFNFYEKLIYELNMDQQKILIACYRLGKTHAEYSKYGMKPHFLDIFHQQLLGQIASIEYKNSFEMEETIIAFIHFNNLIIEAFQDAYRDRINEIREKKKIVEVKLLEEIFKYSNKFEY
ncbi:hypothetical protein Mgra_00003301, partial [Meloidogyne graminicola]